MTDPGSSKHALDPDQCGALIALLEIELDDRDGALEPDEQRTAILARIFALLLAGSCEFDPSERNALIDLIELALEARRGGDESDAERTALLERTLATVSSWPEVDSAGASASIESSDDEDIFTLWRRVQEHPDYAFGTIFVPGDFQGEQIPEDFPASRATDRLAEAGNELIWDLCGDADPDAEPTLPGNEIFELWDRVQAHPDFIFGTIFVPADFPGGELPDDFPRHRAEDRLAEAGNDLIFDLAGTDDEF